MFNAENPKKFRIMTIFSVALVATLLLVGYSNFGSNARLINDYFDRADYAERGVWILTGQVPYRDIPTEYPQIPAGLFGLVTWVAKTILPPEWPVSVGFSILWSVFMMIVFLLTVWQMHRMLPVGSKNLAWLLFLPSVIYFSMNRFDILSVYLGLFVFMFVRDKRFAWAMLFLAIGVFTKWYLGLTLPFILAFEFAQTRKLPWRSVLIFLGVSSLIVLPTFIMGGFQAVWQPYGWHLGRVVEPGTLLWFINDIVVNLTGGKAELLRAAPVFTIIQFMGILSIFITRMDTFKKVVLGSVVSFLVFIIFSRIYSPQWWLWALPFLILSIDNITDVWFIVGYDILNYITFPVIYDLTGRESLICLTLNILGLLILFILTIWALVKLNSMKRSIVV